MMREHSIILDLVHLANHISISFQKQKQIVKEDNVPESGKLLNPLLEETVEITESTNNSSSEDEMEQEEMFVQPHFSLGTEKIEWGGPRRGGRIAEPTRFGDWERKGRCTDF
jgi:hypothetical protein